MTKKVRKLIALILIESFLISSIFPFNPQHLLAEGPSKLAPPLRLGQQVADDVRGALNVAGSPSNSMSISERNVMLRAFLAGLTGFQEVISTIPVDLTDSDINVTHTFFSAVGQIANLAKEFEAKHKSYGPAYIYESLCFVNIDGIRWLGLVVTPFDKRRMFINRDVLVFDAQAEGNFTRHENVNIDQIEMLSEIARNLEEQDIISLALKFRASYLDVLDVPGTTEETREIAGKFFAYYTQKETAAYEILDRAQNLLDELGADDKWLKRRIASLRGIISAQKIKDTVGEIDDLFLEVIQGGKAIKGKPQLAQYILYTGDATRFWYDLLLELDYKREFLRISFSEMPEAKKDYIKNAYEQAVIALWLFAHREDFKTPIGEREVTLRTSDFELSLQPDSLGMLGTLEVGRTIADAIACLDCIGGPCQHGPLGSIAADLDRKADFIAVIEDARENLLEQLGKSGAKDLDDDMSLSELIAKLKDSADRESLRESIYRSGQSHQIKSEEIAVWVKMKKVALSNAKGDLIVRAERLKEKARETGEPSCPLEVPIPEMFRLLREGRLEEAIRLLNKSSFLAGIFGLICPQEYLCQAACTLARVANAPLPIDIGKLEYLIELTYLRLNGELPIPEIKEPTGKEVAILGSGPAGLQAAYDLAKEGHRVVVFEHLHKAGGVLTYGIPTFRLPPEILEEKIRILEEMGVEFVTNTIIGENGAYTIDKLRKSFDTVIIGVGAGQSNMMSISGKVVTDESGMTRLEPTHSKKRIPVPGRMLNGIYSAYHFLSWTFLMNAMKAGYKTPIPLSKRVVNAFKTSHESDGSEVEVNIVVEGVGNVALDSGRTALRWINTLNDMLGTNVKPNIIFLYRRPEEELPLKARDEELHHAMQESVGGVMEFELYQLHQTVEYIGDSNDEDVVAIRCIKFDKAGVKEGKLVDVPADMVIESLGAKPATEILGPSIPLDSYGYIRIPDVSTMQVEGLDGSDGLASVYTVGDCAQAGEINDRIMGTAVLAAMQAKDATKAAIADLAQREPLAEREIDIEQVFFTDTLHGHGMYEIIDRKEIGFREVAIFGHLGIQKVVEFTVYAPHVAYGIKPGQFLTIMADEFGEKIPITYVGKGEIPGSIRFAVQDMGESTTIINKMKKGDSFRAVTGPGGEPSIFTGLAGEISVVGMGVGIAAIVAIVTERARLDERLDELLGMVSKKRDYQDILPALEEVFSGLRLAEPGIIHDIIEVIRNRDYQETQRLLSMLGFEVESEFPDNELVQIISDLNITITELTESIKDPEELDITVKREAFHVIDEIWESLELFRRERALEDISKLIIEQQYRAVEDRLREVTKGGFKTTVVLAARDINILIYKEEIEAIIGKENIIIALESSDGFDAFAEGYADIDPNKNRFFGAYGTIAFDAYLRRAKTPSSGLLVAGPIFGMEPFLDIVRNANRPDILHPQDVWMSTNPPMYCAYGGCLYCLVQKEEQIPWRGCLGPEAKSDRIIAGTIQKRLAMATPHQMPVSVERDQSLTPLAIYQEVDQLKAIEDIEQALREIVYIPLSDGRFFAAVKTDDTSFIIELVDGVPSRFFTGEELSEAIAVLGNVNWNWLGITNKAQKAGYANTLSGVSGLDLSIVLEALKISSERLERNTGIPLRALNAILKNFKVKEFTIKQLWDKLDKEGSLGTLREEIKTSEALGLVKKTGARSETGAFLYELADKVRALPAAQVNAIRGIPFLREAGHIRIRKEQPEVIENVAREIDVLLDDKLSIPIDDIFSGSADLELNIIGMNRVGEFLEVHFSQSDFLQLRELLERVGDKDRLNELLEFTDNKYMVVLDGARGLIAVIIRNEQIQKELLWVEGAPKPELLKYLMLRASIPGVLPFDEAVLTVEKIAEGEGALRAGAVVPSGTSAWYEKGDWTDQSAFIDQGCVSCGACALVCPEGAIQFDTVDALRSGKLVMTVSPDRCAGCTLCIDACHLPGAAIRMMQRTDLKPAAVSVEDISEGRAVIFEGESAAQLEYMFKEQDSGFESLQKAFGVSQIEVFSVNNDFIQLKYQVGNVSYLASFDRIAKRLTVRPLRTFAIVDFNVENIALAGALRDKGFGVIIAISEKDSDFKHKRDIAQVGGMGVYVVEELMEESDAKVRELFESLGLSRFIAVDSASAIESLKIANYRKFNRWISAYTGENILDAVDFLPTLNLDFNEVLESFMPVWEEQIRSFAPGHMLCPGCGQGTDMGFLSDVLAQMNVAPVLIYTTGCLEVSATNFPINSSRWPATHANYTASVGAAAGIWAVYHWHKRMGNKLYGDRELLPIVVQGDGGFAIGLNVTTGSLEQGLPFLLIVENNGGTQNTGAQVSTLSMEGVKMAGQVGTKQTPGLDISSIVTGANPDVYFARVSNSDPEDYKKKLKIAMEWIRQGRGPAVIESFNTACPTGWKADPTEGMEEVSLSVQAAVGRDILFERMGNNIRLKEGVLSRNGNIYINSPYLISLEYELKHLKEDGERLLTDDEVGRIISYVRKQRQRMLIQKVRAKQVQSDLPEVEFDKARLQELAMLYYLNLPTETESFVRNLEELGLAQSEIEAILNYRRSREFTGRQNIIPILKEEYAQVATKALYLITTGGQLQNLLRQFSEDTPSTKELIAGDVFSDIDEFGELLDAEKFSRIKPYLTMVPQRPHVIEYYARQGRFRAMLKAPDRDERLEVLQREVENYLAVMLEMSAMPTSIEVFKRFDEIIEAEVSLGAEPFKYSSAREAHRDVFGLKYNVPEDSNRMQRIAERKVLLDERVFQERWHGRAGQGAITAADFLVIFAAMVEGMDVRDFPRFGVARTGAAVAVNVRLGNRIREHNTPVTDPDIVVVIDETLLDSEVVEGLESGGYLLINSAKSPAQIRAQLKVEGIELSGINIFTVDATRIGRKYLGENRQNIPMLAARILVAQLTEVDLGEPQIALDYIYQILEGAFGEDKALLNYEAMKEAIGALQVEYGTFEQMREQVLAERETALADRQQEVETAISDASSTMRKQAVMMNANRAAAWAVAQSGQTKTVFGYPTTPASSVVEYLAQLADMGLPMFVSLSPAEDDVGARLLGAAEAGDVPATGTTSVALTYMFNQHLADLVGKELPIVVNLPIRAINIGALSIFPDESDMAFVRDWGVFLRARNAQEVYNLNLIALRIAKELKTPVFVVYTGFRNSHTNQSVEIIDDYDSMEAYYGRPDRFDTQGTVLDQDDPKLAGPVVGPEFGQELVVPTFERLQNTADDVIAEAFADFEELFGIRSNPFIEYRTEDADEIMVVQGDIEESIEVLVDELRAQGRKVGVIHITVVRPFPFEDFREVIERVNPRAITILDNSKSHFLFDDVIGALKGLTIPVWGPVVYGLMGRDFYKKDAKELFDTLSALSVLEGLAGKTGPITLTEELLYELTKDDKIALSSIQLYSELSSRFEGLSNPETIFSAEELELWRSKPPAEIDVKAFNRWSEAIYALEEKLNLQRWLIEKVKEGNYKDISLYDKPAKMLDAILERFTPEELEAYRLVASIARERVGAKNLSALLEVINQAGNDTRHPQGHLKRDAIFAKLINGRFLDIFSGGTGRTYFYGARRDYDQYKFLHEFIIELAIRISRRLLETGLGTPEQKLMAAEYIFNLTEVSGDLMLVIGELDELKAMRDEPEVLERAGELISLAEERYQSLTSYKTRPVTRGSGTLKRALEQLVDSDYGFGISTFTVKEFYEMALAQLKAKSIAREDEVIETVSETTIRTELNGLVNAGLLKVDKSGKVHVYRFDERVLGAYHSSDEAFSEIADSVDMAKLEDNEAAWIKRRYLDGKLAAALGDELLRYDYLPNLKRIGEGESRTIIIQAESIGEHLGFVASLELMLEYADGKVQVIIDASAVENIKGFLEATGLSMEGEGHRIVIEVNDTKALLETARSNSDHKDKNIVTVGDQGYFRRRNWFSPDYGKVCKLLIEEATEGKANIGILPAAIGLVSGNMLEDLVTVMDNENNLFLLSPQDVSQAYSETLNSYREMLSAM